MQKVSVIELADGRATGVSSVWDGGQFCYIQTGRGVLGCGIFDIDVFEEFGMAGALCKGTPERPLVEPADLLDALVVMVSPRARELGINQGMRGREALAKLLA